MDEEWKRAIVRVWRGRPDKGGKYQGTAFFIAPGYLVTAKHVIEGIAFKNIYLHSDTGAWIEGGLRKIRQPCPHPDPKTDIAVLPLEKPIKEARKIPLAPKHADLSSGQKVTLAGFSTSGGSLETPCVQISAYFGDYSLEVADKPIGKGMSGGPALRDKKLAGVIHAKNDAHTFLIPSRAFDEFINGFRLQSIALSDIEELQQLLKQIKISDADAHSFLRKTAPEFYIPELYEKGTFFDHCLLLLAKMKYVPPDKKAPLFEFLEYCRGKIERQASQKQLSELENWKNRIANCLEIDLQAICDRMERADKQREFSAAVPPVIVIKISPSIEAKKISDSDKFMLNAWTYAGGQYDPMEVSEQYFHREALEEQLADILAKISNKLKKTAKQRPEIEIIMPIQLFDWNVNHLRVTMGSRKIALGTHYPIAIRSWDRIYHPNYSPVIPYWNTKWESCPCSPQRIKTEHIYCIVDKSACDGDRIYLELADNGLLVFLGLVSLSSHQHIQEVLRAILDAGLPFAFWFPEIDGDIAALRAEIETLLCEHDIKAWPEILMRNRLNDEKKKADPANRLFWNDLMMLWDNPMRLPPDADCPLSL
ncbi:MAG: trypsin-like peptidase domain-containing protein [Gammaproteobacteria bacterium]|nr:trypsin-like peptidase domain-containing protein [Gammaproteobacteria bacterium]